MASEGVYRRRSQVPFEVRASVALLLSVPGGGADADTVLAAMGTRDTTAVFYHTKAERRPVGSLECYGLVEVEVPAPPDPAVPPIAPQTRYSFETVSYRRPYTKPRTGQFPLGVLAPAPPDPWSVGHVRGPDLAPFVRPYVDRVQLPRFPLAYLAPPAPPDSSLDVIAAWRRDTLPVSHAHAREKFHVGTLTGYGLIEAPVPTPPAEYIIQRPADRVPFYRYKSLSIQERDQFAYLVIPAEAQNLLTAQLDDVVHRRAERRKIQRSVFPFAVFAPTPPDPWTVAHTRRADLVPYLRPGVRLDRRTVLNPSLFPAAPAEELYLERRENRTPFYRAYVDRVRLSRFPIAYIAGPIPPVGGEAALIAWRRNTLPLFYKLERGPFAQGRIPLSEVLPPPPVAGEPAIIAWKRNQVPFLYRLELGVIARGQMPVSAMVPPPPDEWTVAVLRQRQRAPYLRRPWFEPQRAIFDPGQATSVVLTPILVTPEQLAVFTRLKSLPIPIRDRIVGLVFDGTTVTSGAPEIVDIFVEINRALDFHADIKTAIDLEAEIKRIINLHVER